MEGEKCDYNNEQTVSTCLQPMLDYANRLQEDTGMQFPLHGGSIFNKLCEIYHQFQECVEEVQCTSISIEAVAASYGYMCGPGMPLTALQCPNDFARRSRRLVNLARPRREVRASGMPPTDNTHHDNISLRSRIWVILHMISNMRPHYPPTAPFIQVERDITYMSCKDAATKAMTDAQKKYKNAFGEPYLKAMCSAMDGYLRCSHPTITTTCGNEAWGLVSTVTRDSLRVTMPNCDMGNALF
ncbi:hypothetical protein PRIPAC_92782 [Pristionchus pacificus]|nr:hypothetical protein PRIPAC_92782 [Pristionchus pacificus]